MMATASAPDVIRTSTRSRRRRPGLDVGVEGDRDDKRDEGEDDDERPIGARPFRRHAVARQVARNEVEQPRERRGSGEPQHRDGRHVVDGAEEGAELLVSEVCERAPGRGPSRQQQRSRYQHRRHHAAGHQQHAHDAGRRRAEFLRVADAAVRIRLRVAGSPFTSGMTATPVSNPDKPERQLWEDDERGRDHRPAGSPCCAE